MSTTTNSGRRVVTTQSQHVQSVSSGGESVTIDVNSQKAEQRYEESKDLTNIANRRVRKTFGAITGAFPS